MKTFIAILSAAVLAFLSGCGAKSRFFQDQFLKTSGSRIVDQKGNEVCLYGINIGGWMLIEPGLLKLDNKPGVVSGKDLFDRLESRFGKNQARELYRTYMENFITKDDIKYIADTGMNFIRVPVWHAALTDPKYAGKEFSYLDRIIRWAKSSHLYVLIDLRGAPGGQSTNAEKTGESAVNQMWTDPEKLNQTIQLWKRIAMKYKNERIVAGYDLLDEPTGAPSLPSSMKDLVHFYDILYRTVREIDTNHIIFIEDAGMGVQRMPHPKSMGWENVVYSFHFYPTVDDGTNTLSAVNVLLPEIKSAQVCLDVPFHVGEFNTLRSQDGGVPYLKKLFKAFRAFGWSWNLWTYKKIEDNTNQNGGLTGLVDTQTDIDLDSATFDIFRDMFRQYNSIYLKRNEEMEAAVREFSSAVNSARCTQRLTNDLELYPEESVMARNTGSTFRMDWKDTGPVFTGWGQDDSAGWLVYISAAGVYRLDLKYQSSRQANFSVRIDGHEYTAFSAGPSDIAGTAGKSEAAFLLLTNGGHILELISAQAENGALELLSAHLALTDGVTNYSVPDNKNVVLAPQYFYTFNQTNGDVSMDWQGTPACMRYWMNGEAVTWVFESDADASYNVTLEVASTNGGCRFRLVANAGEKTNSVSIPKTGDMGKYRKTEAVRMKFRQGVNLISVIAETPNTGPAGNLGVIRLRKSKE